MHNRKKNINYHYSIPYCRSEIDIKVYHRNFVYDNFTLPLDPVIEIDPERSASVTFTKSLVSINGAMVSFLHHSVACHGIPTSTRKSSINLMVGVK